MTHLGTRQSTPARRRARGFTLIELMITVAVIGILARIALPSYLEYVKRGKLTEAFNGLSGYSLAMTQAYQDSRSYIATAGNAACVVTAPTGSNFTYTCTASSATAYIATATGNSGSPVSGFVFTVNQNGDRTTVTSGSAANWPSSTSCWISSRSGACQ